MKISYNYVSVVALGNFNPSILSVDFLKQVCKIDLGKPRVESPPDIPIHKVLQFENFVFIAALDRLEIKETAIKDISQTRTLEFFNSYYSELRHTPLKAVGVNINSKLHPKTRDTTAVIAEKVKNPGFFLDFLGVGQANVTETAVFKEDEKIWLASNYRLEKVRGLARHINVSKEGDYFNVNYNYEAGNLHEDKSRLDLLINGYNNFSQEFLTLVERLEDN